MSKYLLVTVVLLIALSIWRHKHHKTPQHKTPQHKSPHKTPRTPGASAGAAPAVMVRCAHCGVHLPGPDALAVGPLHYCCAAHRAHGPRAI